MFRTFRGGQSGGWRITSISPVTGEPLAFMPALSVTDSEAIALPLVPSRNAWRLVGVASSLRYTERAEKQQLTAVQGRPRPAGSNQRGADPDPQVAGLVGSDPGRAPQDI
ncbi:hypothetical protein ACVWWO_006242 [Bradyrhizobium sp. F1.13.1]